MPLYDYWCPACGNKIEFIARAEEKYRQCPGTALKERPELIAKCEGVMVKLPGIFNIHDPWKWMVVTSDGLGVIQDPGDPVDTLYDSLDEQEFYEGPEGHHAYPHESIAPMRYYDGIPWWHREEWEIAQAEQEATKTHEE